MWWIQVLEMDSRAISNYGIDLYRSWMGQKSNAKRTAKTCKTSANRCKLCETSANLKKVPINFALHVMS